MQRKTPIRAAVLLSTSSNFGEYHGTAFIWINIYCSFVSDMSEHMQAKFGVIVCRNIDKMGLVLVEKT